MGAQYRQWQPLVEWQLGARQHEQQPLGEWHLGTHWFLDADADAGCRSAPKSFAGTWMLPFAQLPRTWASSVTGPPHEHYLPISLVAFEQLVWQPFVMSAMS